MGRRNKEGFLKRNFNVARWMGIEDVFTRMRLLPELFRGITSVKQGLHKETYEEAVVRLGLTRKEIEQKKNSFLRASVMYLFFGLMAIVYGLSFIKSGKWQGCFLSSMVALIFLSHAFQTHFWYVQMKKCKLGITVREWACALFGY